MIINNNKKLLLGLQILGKKDIAAVVAEGERVPICIQYEMIRFKLSHKHSTTVPYVKHMYSRCSKLLQLFPKYQPVDTAI